MRTESLTRQGSSIARSPVNYPRDGRSRVVVEAVLPEIDDGRFRIKRTIGEVVEVTAHAHADGHDVLSVRLRYRAGEGNWLEVAMAPLGNDEWQARFTAEILGTYPCTVEAWVDSFLSWRRELDIKAAAGADVTARFVDGAALAEAAAARCAREAGTRPQSARST